MGSDNEGDSSSTTANVLDKFRSMDIVNYIGVEDFADELSYKWTASLLSALCALVTMKTYFFQPVTCFTPNPIGFAVENQYDYVNNYCWTEGTYAVHPLNFTLKAELEDAGLSTYQEKKIIYYQWVPFVLALQAMLFYLPRLIWHTLSYDRAGTDVGHVVRVASDAAHASGDRHDKMVNHASRMLDQMLQRSCTRALHGADPVRGAWLRLRRYAAVVMPAKMSGSWLILMYLVIKVIYLGNVLAQLSLMRTFLGIESSEYDYLGVRLLWDIATGRDWQISGLFPRVGCCAVYMRTAALGNWLFVQCVLPVNMINEKIYTFLWFWFVFVSLATAISLVAWIVRVFKTSCGNRFINRMLKLSDNYQEVKANEYLRAFCRMFLRRDGTFVLKMIALNCGDIICSEIVQRMWTLYREHKGFEHSACDLSGMLALKCPECESGKPHQEGLRHRRCGLVQEQPLQITGGVGGGGDGDGGGGCTAEDTFKNATAPCEV